VEKVSIGLAKGKLFSSAVELMASAGLPVQGLSGETRKLIYDLPDYRFVIMRSFDVPTYVEAGAVDVGVVGKDVLMEQGGEVYELLDLGLTPCRIVLAAPAGRYPDGEW